MARLRKLDSIIIERIKLEQALSFHLQYNHFPPVDPTFAKSAKEAINNALSDDFDKKVQLPNGRLLASSEIIEKLHLDPFLEHRMSQNGV